MVVLRFGHDYDPTCMQMDEVLYGIAELVKNYAGYIWLTSTRCRINTMYQLYDPCTTMFFFRNKHIMIDLALATTTKSIGRSMRSRKSLISLRLSTAVHARAGVLSCRQRTTAPSIDTDLCHLLVPACRLGVYDVWTCMCRGDAAVRNPPHHIVQIVKGRRTSERDCAETRRNVVHIAILVI